MTINKINKGQPPNHVQKVLKNKIGRLTIAEYFGKYENKYYIKVVCECGQEKIVDASNVIWGTTVSCGCYNREIHKKTTKLSFV